VVTIDPDALVTDEVPAAALAAEEPQPVARMQRRKKRRRVRRQASVAVASTDSPPDQPDTAAGVSDATGASEPAAGHGEARSVSIPSRERAGQTVAVLEPSASASAAPPDFSALLADFPEATADAPLHPAAAAIAAQLGMDWSAPAPSPAPAKEKPEAQAAVPAHQAAASSAGTLEFSFVF